MPSKTAAGSQAASKTGKVLCACSFVVFILGNAGAQGRKATGDSATGTAALAVEMLTAHNTVRAGVSIPDLEWSEELAKVAGKWAGTLLAENRFSHSPDTRYGENLFAVTGTSVSPAVVVRHWASEAKNYDYASNTCTGICGHYTQIVWRDTTKVGCAVARGGGREVWVCNYDPPGNWVGYRPYVPAPIP